MRVSSDPKSEALLENDGVQHDPVIPSTIRHPARWMNLQISYGRLFYPFFGSLCCLIT